MMWSSNAREVVERVGSAVAYVEVENPTTGDLGIGSCFHIGGSYFVTARHVIDGVKIRKVGRFDTSLKTRGLPDGRISHTTTHPEFHLEKVEGIYLHPSEGVDIAILRLPGHYAPAIPLSLNANSLTEGEFLMSEVIVLGYPPISGASRPHLVVFRGEVSAVMEHYTDKQRHFVISGMARGGFSGGPVVRTGNPNAALGVVARALVEGEKAQELGFVGALSTKPILETIDAHGLQIAEVQRTLRGYSG